MQKFSKLVLALAAASCSLGAVAQSDQADADRRARNREEAIARHQGMVVQRDADTMQPRKETAGERVRDGTRSTRDFTHRQLDKMRSFSDRQNRRYPAPARTTPEPNKAPTAIGK